MIKYDSYGTGGEVDAEELRKEQSAKSDFGKAKLSLVPRRIIWDIAAIREYGNNKYPAGGPDNWRTVEASRYRDSCFRHFLAYLDDPNGTDDESGLPHLWHLACNIAFLCEMEDIHLSKNPEVVKKLKEKFKVEDKECTTDEVLREICRDFIGIVDETGSDITIDDRVSITKPKTKRTEKSFERYCGTCKYGEPGVNFEKCKTCDEGWTNWEPETEEG